MSAFRLAPGEKVVEPESYYPDMKVALKDAAFFVFGSPVSASRLAPGEKVVEPESYYPDMKVALKDAAFFLFW
ncbi:MAG: hypothetical protein KGZ82_07130 [Bacteroidales bacterium]|nr:hypothetical protein [Bacteroidales bacterium]